MRFTPVVLLSFTFVLAVNFASLAADPPQETSPPVTAQVVKGDEYTKQLSESAGVPVELLVTELETMTREAKTGAGSTWHKIGKVTLRVVKKCAGNAGVVYEVYSNADNVEKRVESGELTRDQAIAEHSKNAADKAITTIVKVAGATGGTLIGTALFGPAGGLVGSVVCGHAGELLGEEIAKSMAEHGITDKLVELLKPVTRHVRDTAISAKTIGSELVDSDKNSNVNVASTIGDVAVDGAGWVEGQATTGWRFVRRQFK